MVKYKSEEVEKEKGELSQDLKSHKKKKRSKDGDAENINSTQCIPSPEESGNKKHKKHKNNPKHLEEEIQEENVQQEVKLKKSKKHKHQKEEKTATENCQNGGVPVSKENPGKSDVGPKENNDSEEPAKESKKKKRKHKEEIVVVDHHDNEEKQKKKKKHKHLEKENADVPVSKENPDKSVVEPKENNDSEEPAKEKRKNKKHKHLEEENAGSEKTEVPVSKENPDKSDVEPKENNDSEEPAKVLVSKEKSDVEPKENNDSEKPANADGKKKRKPRHPGREERKKEKLKMKKLIADGIIAPEPKTKLKKKRKRKVKRNEKAKDSTVSQVENTPRPKGDIPLEDESTAERKAKRFLKHWKKDKEKWKFVKARQNWLVHHMYNPAKINDKRFKVLLKYMAGMKGYSRKTTLEQAKSVLDAANGDTKAKIHKKIELPDTTGEIQIARAREVIKIL